MEMDNNLSKNERRRLKKEQEVKDRNNRIKTEKTKKIIKFIGWSVFIFIVLMGIIFLLGRVKNLPPTSAQNHTESSPLSHIVTEKMDVRVHKHMLEHADGNGPAGIIINYNCTDFECESDLIDKLSEIVQNFPANVYLAPWPGMSERLVISASGRQKILDSFDEQEIIDFIER